MTRLADRCEWNAWNMATITGEYDPDHTTIPRWRAQGRAAQSSGTRRRAWGSTRRSPPAGRAARPGASVLERDVALAELEPGRRPDVRRGFALESRGRKRGVPSRGV